MADFLFTWKEGKRLSHEKLKEIVDKFKSQVSLSWKDGNPTLTG